MARSILERLLGKDKAEVKYEPYDFTKKYGNKVPEFAEQSEVFDEKLALVLDKMRQEGTSDQIEMIALYEERAKAFLKVVSQNSSSSEGKFFSWEMLWRSIQMFDDVLEGNDASENNEQCLLLIRDMDKEADFKAGSGAFLGFLSVAILVTAIVLATTIDPILLVLLVYAIPVGLLSDLEFSDSDKASEQQEAMTSFTESGKGFFSDAAEGEPAKDEPEQEAGKGLWSRIFGGEGEK